MGTKNKGLSGLVAGASAGSALGPWGALGGAVLGGVAGEATGAPEPEKVSEIDPAFMTSLYNQSTGAEKTAADMKMKAAFDKTLAEQVAAARASRGVNPALLQRNVSRLAAEQGAKGAQVAEEENLKNQDAARMRYLQALQLNKQIQTTNVANQNAADVRSQQQLGSLINSAGAIGSTFATAKGPENTGGGENAMKDPISTGGLTLSDSPQKAAQLNNGYTLGANQQVPQYGDNDLTVMSDERQKDLIKNESLPQNGNLGMQNQQAMQPQPMQAQAAPPAAAPVAAPAAAPVQPAPAAPAPITPAQTALAQANASLAKGGKVDDLQVKSVDMQAPSEGPSAEEIQNMLADAQRRETRNWDNSVDQSADDNYSANLARWYANQTQKRADYQKQMDDVNKNNMNVNAERSARLSQFYTGNSNANANDIAQIYTPKAIMPNTEFHAAQNQQAALGIKNQTSGALDFMHNPKAQQAAALATGVGFGGTSYLGGPLATQAPMGVLSDERTKDQIAPQSKERDAKTNMQDEQMNPKHFLDKLTAYSYEYKKGAKQSPDAGDGRYLSVMAQDLEKAGPVGQSMVKQDASGVKHVDYGKGFGGILAAQVHLNERLAALEAKYQAKNKKG